MERILNKEQVQDLFQKEAVLIGQFDVVPLYRATELFGDKAVEYAYGVKDSSNCFGIGNYSLPYLTYKGFQLAASFRNVEIVYKSMDNKTKGIVA